jgi:hypothetical protein
MVQAELAREKVEELVYRLLRGPPLRGGGRRWQNWESISDQDVVVVWYGANFSDNVQHEPPGSHATSSGPT